MLAISPAFISCCVSAAVFWVAWHRGRFDDNGTKTARCSCAGGMRAGLEPSSLVNWLERNFSSWDFSPFGGQRCRHTVLLPDRDQNYPGDFSDKLLMKCKKSV